MQSIKGSTRGDGRGGEDMRGKRGKRGEREKRGEERREDGQGIRSGG